MLPRRRKIGIGLQPIKSRRELERRDVTVCIAMTLTWIYGENDFGHAILTASDRMLTAGDTQYEPRQQKLSWLTPSVMLMVAGDMTVHTEALTYTARDIDALTDPMIEEVVSIYASHIRNIRRKRAESLYLDPLGLSIDTFLSNQKNMLPQIVVDITNEIRTFSLEIEALIVGCKERKRRIHLSY
jgi:hypothetical protein